MAVLSYRICGTVFADCVKVYEEMTLMNNLLLESNKKNLYETLLNDTIDRNDELFYFVKLINEIEGGNVIAINGAWGSGKTFFIKHAKMILDSYNDNNDPDGLNTNELEKVKTAFINIGTFKGFAVNSTVLQPKKAATLYYDAWKNDSSDDPLLSLIYAIVTRFNKNLSINKRAVVKNMVLAAGPIVNQLVKGFTGVDIKNELDIIKNVIEKNEDFLEVIKKESDLDKRITDLLTKITCDDEEKLVIFVDELDRCNPLFAIRLLERIKHYFSNPNIVFVFACNLKELQHSIKSQYGTGFDAHKYLQKFFNYIIELGPIDNIKYMNSFIVDNDTVNANIKLVASMYNFQMRELLQYYSFTIGASKNLSRIMRNDTFGTRNSLAFYVAWFMPFAVGLRYYDNELYAKFIRGEAFEEYTHFLELTNFEYNSYFDCLLNRGEYFYTRDEEPRAGEIGIDKNLRTKEAYVEMFNPEDKESTTRLGRIVVDSNTRKLFWNVCNGISSFANFN